MDEIDKLLAVGEEIIKDLQLYIDEKSEDVDRLCEIRMRARQNDDDLIRAWCSEKRTIL